MADLPTVARPSHRKPTAALVGTGLLVVLLGVGLPRALQATGPTEPTGVESLPDAGPSLSGPLARLGVGAAVVCCVWLGVGRVFRRPASPATAGMQVRASLAVDARAAVYLVNAGGRRLLVGVDHAGVKALIELPGAGPEPVTDATAVGPVRAVVPGPAVFGARVAAALGRV